MALGTPINQAANSRVPPAWTTLPPARGPLARSRLFLTWHAFLGLRRLLFRIWGHLGYGVDLCRVLRRYAVHCGCDPRELRCDSYIAPRLDLPELVAFPAELDFPEARRKGRLYLWEPLEAAAGEPAVGEDPRPLVYCSLGTVPRLSRERRIIRFFRGVLDAAAARPDRR